MASIVEDVRDIADPDVGDALALAAFVLAKRFAAGATLWCFAPEWPAHARHVAVEFVHPVLVGKRALPAVSIHAVDPSCALRSLVRPGDVVLAVSGPGSAATTDVMRRAPAWGATSIWITAGGGGSHRHTSADHIVPAGGHDADSPAEHDGRLVLLYHVLWELTHVCFEHPGLLTEPDVCSGDGEVCVTCSDEGRVGEVITADSRGWARVRTSGGDEVIDTTIVDEVAVGDLVLIHAGMAIAVLP